MEELYKLKDMLCDELEEYGRKGELSTGSLDVVDKLSHALKSITTVIAMEEADGYSGEMRDGNYSRSYYPTYNRGSSYAGRRNARRDSMGRYSRAEEMDGVVESLREIMNDAPNDNVRQEIQRLVSKVEKM